MPQSFIRFRSFVRKLYRESKLVPAAYHAFRLRTRKGSSLTLYGFYGASDESDKRNIGDSAILVSMLGALDSIPIHKLISVFDNEGKYLRYGEEFEAGIGANELTKWLPIIERTKLLLMGGGGLFQDYGAFSLTPFVLFRLALLFWLAGRKMMWYSIGVGPLGTKQGRLFTYLAARLANLVTVRDNESKALLSQIGVPENVIYVTADPAVTLSPPLSNRPKEGGNRCVGLSLLPFYQTVFGDERRNQDLEGILAEFVQSLLDEDMYVKLLAFHNGPDAPACERIAAHLNDGNLRVVGPGMDVEQMLSEYESMDCFIGMRFHSLVFAYITSVPAGAIAYHPKVRSLVHSAQLEDYSLGLEDLTAAGLQDLVARLRRDRLAVREKMAIWVDSQRQQVAENAKLVESLLEQPA